MMIDNKDTVIIYRSNSGNVMAILIKAEHKGKGIEFFSNNEDYFQIACMNHPAGHEIVPHFHNRILRTIDYTCETLIIREGALLVNLFEEKEIVHSFKVSKGDILTLYSGGHGFVALENLDMVEIKQGPYLGQDDKTRF